MKQKITIPKESIKDFVEANKHLYIKYSFCKDWYELEFSPEGNSDDLTWCVLIDDIVNLILWEMNVEEVCQAIDEFEKNPKAYWKKNYNKNHIIVI